MRGAAQVAQAMPIVGPALSLVFTFMTFFLSRVRDGPGVDGFVQASWIMTVVVGQVYGFDERGLDLRGVRYTPLA